MTEIKKIDKEKVDKYLKKWQKNLRLKDWDLKIHLVEQSWRKTGDIKIDTENKMAVVMLNNFNPYSDNWESIIVHELMHLKLWGLDQMIEKLIYNVFDSEEDPGFQIAYNDFMMELETTAEDFTKSFIALGGKNKKLNFGRVEKQVKEELNKRN